MELEVDLIKNTVCLYKILKQQKKKTIMYTSSCVYEYKFFKVSYVGMELIGSSLSLSGQLSWAMNAFQHAVF